LIQNSLERSLQHKFKLINKHKIYTSASALKM